MLSAIISESRPSWAGVRSGSCARIIRSNELFVRSEDGRELLENSLMGTPQACWLHRGSGTSHQKKWSKRLYLVMDTLLNPAKQEAAA